MALTKENAVALYESRWWEHVTDEYSVAFQLFEERLCMPFTEFHKRVEAVLGRPVFTHEFGTAGAEQLRAEFRKERPQPSFEQILDLIPKEKLIVSIIGDAAS